MAPNQPRPVRKPTAEDLEIVTVTRIIEYTGPRMWVESTLSRSAVPLSGVKQFTRTALIKSGTVNWGEVEVSYGSVETGPGISSASSSSGDVDRILDEATTKTLEHAAKEPIIVPPPAGRETT